MKTYVIKGIKVIVNKVCPFPGFVAMAMFGVIFWRKDFENRITDPKYAAYLERVINHESIHKAQMKDFCKWLPLGGLLFYIHYGIEWVFRLFTHPETAYRGLSFEQEAYLNEKNLEYLETRERFAEFKKK